MIVRFSGSSVHSGCGAEVEFGTVGLEIDRADGCEDSALRSGDSDGVWCLDATRDGTRDGMV